MSNSRLSNARDKNRWLREGAKFRASVFTKCRLGLQGETEDWSARKDLSDRIVRAIGIHRMNGTIVTLRCGSAICAEHAKHAIKILGENVWIVFANYLQLGAFKCNGDGLSRAISCLVNFDGDSIFCCNEEETDFFSVDYDADWHIESERYELLYAGSASETAEKLLGQIRNK